MKKNIVASIIAATVVCTGASGMIGYSIGGNNAREAAAIEKSIEMEELHEQNSDALAQMRTEKINAILGERDAKKEASDQRIAKLSAESKKAATDRAAKELKSIRINVADEEI